MAQLYVLFEHAVGYCLFRVKEFEEIGSFLPQVEEAVNDASKFQKVVHLAGFRAFKNAASALANINAVSEGIMTEDLSAFLETNLPKSGKKNKVTLGVVDPKLGAAISEALQITITHTGVVPELVRGIRFHLTRFVKGLSDASMKQSELGLGHSYSRGKVKFNIHRVDNMIIQTIALVDQLDKDINNFSMRIREWYSYHFPELSKVVPDNYQFVLCANYIKNRNLLNDEMLERLEEITMDSAKAQAILDAGRMSMGMDISPIDLMNIEVFAKKVANLAEYRQKLAKYLKTKMNDVAPNLSTLIGEVVGARLISHAGSLTNLAKYPASTVQILGAEKALFRALKTKSRTPKYGLIYHSTFIGRAGSTNKGRISRYLANKCSLASRIDCFSDVPTNIFGEKLRGQVEERLKFYESGDLPRKNVDVMSEAVVDNDKAVKKIEKKRKAESLNDTAASDVNGSLLYVDNGENGAEPPKKKKKKKKAKELDGEAEEMDNSQVEVFSTPRVEGEKKKKKKQKEAVDESMEASFMNESQDLDSSDVRKKKKKKKKTVQEAED